MKLHKQIILYLSLNVLFMPNMASYAMETLVVKKPRQQSRYVIENPAIIESSGLACSTRNQHVLWTHNDSGHMPIIYALSTKGNDLGSYFIDGVESIDWEDMDAFQYQGQHYLLVADSGDNFRVIWEHKLFIIEEPIPGSKPHPTLNPSWSVTYRFENNASYDVEAVGVDSHLEKIILLSKRHKPTLMFELPLKPKDTERLQTARKIAELPSIKYPSALDFSADGRLMSINTYRRIHRFSRKKPGAAWQYQYSIKYQAMFQPEAMCLTKNQKNYYVTSEKKTNLLKIRAQ